MVHLCTAYSDIQSCHMFASARLHGGAADLHRTLLVAVLPAGELVTSVLDEQSATWVALLLR